MYDNDRWINLWMVSTQYQEGTPDEWNSVLLSVWIIISTWIKHSICLWWWTMMTSIPVSRYQCMGDPDRIGCDRGLGANPILSCIISWTVLVSGMVLSNIEVAPLLLCVVNFFCDSSSLLWEFHSSKSSILNSTRVGLRRNISSQVPWKHDWKQNITDCYVRLNWFWESV
jgi:hypothetical protein